MKRELVVGAVVLVFAGAAFLVTLRFDEVPEMLSPISPARFPQLVLAVMALLAVLLMARAPTATATPPPSLPRTTHLTAFALLLFLLVQPWLGTLPTAGLFLCALPLLWGENRYRILVPYALAVPAAIYALFTKGLHVRFPWGVFE